MHRGCRLVAVVVVAHLGNLSLNLIISDANSDEFNQGYILLLLLFILKLVV